MAWSLKTGAVFAALTSVLAWSGPLAASTPENRYYLPYEILKERTLEQVAMRLYGDTAMSARIAEWNDLPVDRPLERGQVLTIRKAPAITLAEGDALLDKSGADLPATLHMKRKKRSIASLESESIEARAERARESAERFIASVRERADEARKIAEQFLAHLAEEKRQREEEQKRKEQLAQMQQVQEEAAAAGEEEEKEEDQLNAEAEFTKGQEAYNAKNYDLALEHFRKARQADAERLPPWLYEIRILRMKKEDALARETAESLFERSPELRDLPMFNFLKQN